MRFSLKRVIILPEKAGFRLYVDVTLLKLPKVAHYAEIVRGYVNKEYSLIGGIIMLLKVWFGIKGD